MTQREGPEAVRKVSARPSRFSCVLSYAGRASPASSQRHFTMCSHAPICRERLSAVDRR